MAKNTQSGAALVELAISLFVMISIAFGITEFGRAIYEYNTLAKAARDATRFLATRNTIDTLAKNQARCLAVYGNPIFPCEGTPLAPGLTVEMVRICDASDATACPDEPHSAVGTAPVMNLVTVMIGGPNATPYTFNSLVSFVVPDIVFGRISVTMRQVL